MPLAISPAAVHAAELNAEARCGTGLARALVEHVVRMDTNGYSNELLVAGELWTISVERRHRAT